MTSPMLSANKKPSLPSGSRGWAAMLLCVLALAAGCDSHAHVRSIPSRELARTPLLAHVLSHAREHRFQLLVSEVVTDAHAKPALHRRGYRVDAEYFYPASAIKLAAAVAALQQAERLGGSELLDAPLEIAPLFPGDPAQSADSTNEPTRTITLAHEIKKLALVSDNQAFNRLYDFVGHEQLNRAMHDAGFPSVIINHRLSDPRAIPSPLDSAAVRVHTSSGDIDLPARHSTLSLVNSGRRGLLVGDGFMRGDTLVPQPMDFSRRNAISLVDLQNLLIAVVRPDVDLGIPGVLLSSRSREHLVHAMTIYPRECTNPRYDPATYSDDYCKFILPGIRRVFPDASPGSRVQITGKIGQAYGFTIENCYVRHPISGRAFFLTAVLYTNADGILNDDHYEYESIAQPALADLGELFAHELLQDHDR